MPGAGRGKRPSRRKHSFGGCKTCRRRHVKCDQIRPACLACRAINVTCEGYDEGVRWLPPATLFSPGTGQFDNEVAGENTTRHHLFSVSSRASMSTSLRQCFGSGSVDASLAQIDARTRDLQTDEEDISIGPFGVLNIVAPEASTKIATVDCPPVPQIDLTVGGSVLDGDQMTNENGTTNVLDPGPALVDWFDPILGINDSLQWSDLFSLDFDTGNSLLMPQYAAHYSEHEFGMIQPDSGIALSDEILRAHDPAPSNYPLSSASAHTFNESHPPGAPVGIEQHRIFLAEVDSPTEAQFLLKHFYDFIIPGWSFMPSNTKSPWTIFQLSEAAISLSEMTFLQTGLLKHANAANLYGILACSAYHLSVSSGQTTKEPEYWMGLFIRLRSQANVHMQVSLREELKGPAKAKYKDQLMAILAMLACATVSGHHADARRYIIDAERLIRVKGLAKRQISRKCRFLHHVYSWIRVVGESTYVLHDYTHYGSVIDNMSTAYRAGRLHAGSEHVEKPPPRSGHNARLDDFLRLEPHQSDSDLDIEESKGEIGLHDIHLNDSRRYHNTMYHEIYGISETWLSLVSQTTRLANILDATRYGKDTDSHFLEFLNKRSGRLEHIVCSWALRDPGADETEGDGTAAMPRPVNYHMMQAMNSALVILFYRRIRNVNPLILQGHVGSVIQSLRDFDQALLSEGLSGPGSAWPAFIAGCEALSRQNRTSLMAWLDKGFEKCGLETFNISMTVMKEVWKRHDERTLPSDPGSVDSNQSRSSRSTSNQPTWVDVCKEQDVWVTLY